MTPRSIGTIIVENEALRADIVALRAERDAFAKGCEEWQEAASRSAGELSAISAAIGSVRFMDPPDGGDVSLAEQVSRMRQALEREEKWREKFDCCMCGSRMGDHDIGSGHSPVSMYDYHQSQLETRANDAEAEIDRLTKALALAILATT